MTMTTYQVKGVLVFDASRKAIDGQLAGGKMRVSRYECQVRGRDQQRVESEVELTPDAGWFGWECGDWCKVENPNRSKREKGETVAWSGAVWFPSAVSPGRLWVLLFDRRTGDYLELRIVDHDWLTPPPEWWHLKDKEYTRPVMPWWSKPVNT